MQNGANITEVEFVSLETETPAPVEPTQVPVEEPAVEPVLEPAAA